MTKEQIAKIIFGQFEGVHPEVYYGTVQDHAEAAADAILAAQQNETIEAERLLKLAERAMLNCPARDEVREYLAGLEQAGDQ